LFVRNLAGFREPAAGLDRATGGTLPGGVPHRLPGWSTAMNTPWGKAESIRNIADGIDFVSTAGHGGFVLSAARMAEMPLELRALSFSRDRFFEEDWAWAAVPLAFPDAFPPDHFAIALKTYRDGIRHGYGAENAGWFGRIVDGLLVGPDHNGMIARLEAKLAEREVANA
jgi:hypothetical protein